MTAQDIKILGVTVTYNNEDKIPYVMPYYERIGIDKLIVYDNGSTDRTVELLSKYPFVEIRTYYTDKYDERKILEFKTNIQNEFAGQYNWCISTYFDEVFYCERDIREVLYEKMLEGKTYFLKTGLNIFSRTFPPTNNGKLIHENVGRGSLWTSDDGIMGIYGTKAELFDMQKLKVTYDYLGCHKCSFWGQISPFEDEISFFHLKFIDFDFIVRSNELYRQRTEGTGILCYDYFSKNMEKVYQLMEKRAISVEEYMKTPMRELLPQQVVFAVNEINKERQKKYIDTLSLLKDKSYIQQYGLLFYGFPKQDNSEMWSYGVSKGVYTAYSVAGNAKDALGNDFVSDFNSTIIPEPWIVEISDESELTFEFLTEFEKKLPSYNKDKVRECEIYGHKFTKFNRFISTKEDVTLGCYMIVKDEEKNIKKCLDSIIDVCDEIVVVDTGCSDKTMEIAKSFGDKIKTYKFKWIGDFSAARNFALSKITTDFSFTTDADEEFSENLKNKTILLKENNFYNTDWFDIWLLNYNGTTNAGYYLGGRQFIRVNKNPHWKYKIHEKVYTDDCNVATIPFEEGYIIHKHDDGKNARSNYNKYAEIYFNEITDSDFLSPKNSVHFFYYMFLTLKDFDMFAAKRYLYFAYDKSRIAVPNEDIRVHLLKDGYISSDDFIAFNSVQNMQDFAYISNLAAAFSDPFPSYLLRKRLFDVRTTRYFLTLENMADLALYSYQMGLILEFVNIITESVKMYGEFGTNEHNMGFIKAYIEPFNEKNALIIDCRGGIDGLASNYYYFSQKFKNISILVKDEEQEEFIKSRFSLSLKSRPFIKNENEINKQTYFIADGNNQMNRETALSEFENAMYGRQTTVLTKKTVVK